MAKGQQDRHVGGGSLVSERGICFVTDADLYTRFIYQATARTSTTPTTQTGDALLSFLPKIIVLQHATRFHLYSNALESHIGSVSQILTPMHPRPTRSGHMVPLEMEFNIGDRVRTTKYGDGVVRYCGPHKVGVP